MNDFLANSIVLKVKQLSYFRNEERIFGPIDFSLSGGNALLVTGDNGSGKTTLLRVLSGLLKAQSGEIIASKPDRAHSNLSHSCAYLAHKPGHKAELTCIENLEYLQTIFDHLKPELIEPALEKVGLSGYEDTAAKQLSAGQNKRLGLARLLLSHSPCWLLDEPYANLDLQGIELVNRIIQEHTERGGAVLLTTHGAYAAPSVPYQTLILANIGKADGG
ncbi:MAG: heme ABC exporter ATP-binding protein CcmA [Arenimonas sp.]